MRAAEVGVVNQQVLPISRLLCPFFVLANYILNKQNQDHSYNAFICCFGYILAKTLTNFPMYCESILRHGTANLVNGWEFKREFIIDSVISFGFGYVNKDVNNLNYPTMGVLATAINLLAYGPIIIDAYMNRNEENNVREL